MLLQVVQLSLQQNRFLLEAMFVVTDGNDDFKMGTASRECLDASDKGESWKSYNCNDC